MAFCRKVPVRLRILILIFFSRYMITCLTSNLYLDIIYMVQREGKVHAKPWCILKDENKSSIVRNKSNELLNPPEPDYGPRYKWTSDQQRLISDSYWWGILIASIPAGIMAEYLGPFYVIFWSTLITAILNVLLVPFASMHWKAVSTLVFFIGCNYGLIVPAIMVWIARWAPPNERGIFVSANTAEYLGSTTMRMQSRFMIPLVGWRGHFYYTSSKVLLFCVPLWFFGSNSFDSDRFITNEEKTYIIHSQRGKVTSTKSVPPYGRILRSRAFWTLNILNFGFVWGTNFQLRVTPGFLHSFIGFSMNKVAYLDVMPKLGLFATAVLSGAIADFLRTKSIYNNTTVVKTFVFFSHILPGCSLLFMGMAYCNPDIVLALLFLGIIFIGSSLISVVRTAIDIAPNYAGTIFGLLQFSTKASGVLAPRMQSALLQSGSGIIGWTLVFLIGGGCLIGTAIIFIFFGDVRCQWWNQKSQDRKLPKQKPKDNDGGKSTTVNT